MADLSDRSPRAPENLDPLAREILERLEGHPEAEAIILGGGVALQHYCAFRQTKDIDAWWQAEIRRDTELLLRRTMEDVAREHGFDLSTRHWGDTESLELLSGNQKIFCFQISLRDVQLDPAKSSSWEPVKIETFRDNLGAKMNALVERGAPRDFVDVHEVCRRGLAQPDSCWQSWQDKNPDRSLKEARARVLQRLAAIESRRPLETISDPDNREQAHSVRLWVKRTLCRVEDRES